jgi:nicotinamide-nucleotide amidase
MMATAESCTGGLIAGACTDLAGSSNWFERGFVTYSNEAKTELLGVDAALIATHGAVSEVVARAMAFGAARHSRAKVSVAVTGVAGPGGGSADKPVGTGVVWLFGRRRADERKAALQRRPRRRARGHGGACAAQVEPASGMNA